MKLNLGAGNDIKDGFINHDISQLPGKPAQKMLILK
jgi:hypothetical protein